MRYEFSWPNGSFTTSCPIIGETMMRSTTDFPKRSPEIQQQFDAVYGEEWGKFEKLLRDAEINGSSGPVKTGIANLTVQAIRDAGIRMC